MTSSFIHRHTDGRSYGCTDIHTPSTPLREQFWGSASCPRTRRRSDWRTTALTAERQDVTLNITPLPSHKHGASAHIYRNLRYGASGRGIVFSSLSSYLQSWSRGCETFLPGLFGEAPAEWARRRATRRTPARRAPHPYSVETHTEQRQGGGGIRQGRLGGGRVRRLLLSQNV